MNRKEFEKYIEINIPHFYSFSHCLVPDDLQAQQIVIDAVTAVTIKENDIIKQLLDAHETVPLKLNLLLDECKYCCLKYIFQIGKKRFSQLGASLDFKENHQEKENPFDYFYKLDVDARACLYLKEKLQFPIERIAQVLSWPEHKVMAILNKARHEVLKQMEDPYLQKNI